MSESFTFDVSYSTSFEDVEKVCASISRLFLCMANGDASFDKR